VKSIAKAATLEYLKKNLAAVAAAAKKRRRRRSNKKKGDGENENEGKRGATDER